MTAVSDVTSPSRSCPRSSPQTLLALQRFEREARALAAINHPHIATIHGVEEVRGVTALVMELVDGETLSEQIARGPIPIGTALVLAGQIADALDAAHEKGIVHRDLKPSNIKVTPARTIKVLDFGLAKGGETDRRGPDNASGVSDASRLTAIATMDETLPGVLLGTAAYMSPEQARGHAVDKRSDIWAFGCVLFEMLTGRSTFGRSTTTDTIAAVLEHDPDWTALPGNTPPGVVRLLRKCLEKDQRRRLRDLGDWDLIEPAAAVPSPRGQRQIPQWIPWAALIACVGAGGLFLANRQRRVRRRPPRQLVSTFPRACRCRSRDNSRSHPTAGISSSRASAMTG
jgi:serine/threonine protein kinase